MPSKNSSFTSASVMLVDYPKSDNNASGVSIPPSPQLETEIGDELALMFENGCA